MRRWIVLLTTLMLTAPAGLVLAQPAEDQEEDAADLAIEEIQPAPEDPAPGDDVTFQAIIANDGDADAGPFNVTFEINGTLLGDPVEVDGLTANAQTQVSSVPWNASEGEHTVNVTVDTDDAVAEEDEENNLASEDLDVEAREADDDETEDEAEDESDEADDESDEADEDADAEDDDRHKAGENATFTNDNGTVTGENVSFELTTDGILNYTVAGELLFESILYDPPLNASETEAEGISFEAEGEDGEFKAYDLDDGPFEAESESGDTLHLTLADGWNATPIDDERLRLDGPDNRTYELEAEENYTLENSTIHVSHEAKLNGGSPEDGEDRAEEARERAEERREERREAGSQWNHTDDAFTGDHVRFSFDENDSGITDWGLVANDTTIVTSASLGENASDWDAHGRTFDLRGDDSRIKVLDTPNAILLVRGEDEVPATIELDSGVTVDEHNTSDDDRQLYELGLPSNRTMWLAGEEIDFDNGTFTVADKAMLRLGQPLTADASENSGPGSLPDQARADDDDDDDDEDEDRGHALGHAERARVQQGVLEGNISVEVQSGEDGADPVTVETGDVEVSRAEMDPEGERKAHVSIRGPDGAPGTTVTIDLDDSALGNLTVSEATERLEIRFDNETIEAAEDLEDVLNPNDDDGQAEYLLLVGSDEVQILVSVPHFSPHSIDVYETQSSEDATANSTPGLGLLGLVVVGLSAAALRTRKE